MMSRDEIICLEDEDETVDCDSLPDGSSEHNTRKDPPSDAQLSKRRRHGNKACEHWDLTGDWKKEESKTADCVVVIDSSEDEDEQHSLQDVNHSHSSPQAFVEDGNDQPTHTESSQMLATKRQRDITCQCPPATTSKSATVEEILTEGSQASEQHAKRDGFHTTATETQGRNSITEEKQTDSISVPLQHNAAARGGPVEAEDSSIVKHVDAIAAVDAFYESAKRRKQFFSEQRKARQEGAKTVARKHESIQEKDSTNRPCAQIVQQIFDSNGGITEQVQHVDNTQEPSAESMQQRADCNEPTPVFEQTLGKCNKRNSKVMQQNADFDQQCEMREYSDEDCGIHDWWEQYPDSATGEVEENRQQKNSGNGRKCSSVSLTPEKIGEVNVSNSPSAESTAGMDQSSDGGEDCESEEIRYGKYAKRRPLVKGLRHNEQRLKPQIHNHYRNGNGSYFPWQKPDKKESWDQFQNRLKQHQVAAEASQRNELTRAKLGTNQDNGDDMIQAPHEILDDSSECENVSAERARAESQPSTIPTTSSNCELEHRHDVHDLQHVSIDDGSDSDSTHGMPSRQLARKDSEESLSIRANSNNFSENIFDAIHMQHISFDDGSESQSENSSPMSRANIQREQLYCNSGQDHGMNEGGRQQASTAAV